MEKNKRKVISTNTNSIYHFLNPNNNDQLSRFNHLDVSDFLLLLDDYYLVMRNRLGLSRKDTFGMEMEFDETQYHDVEDEIANHNFDNWLLYEDASLDNGGEVVSPILTDTERNWKDLIGICHIVNNHGIINNNCGAHVHIGTQVLGDDVKDWLRFMKLWAVYENIIYRFSYGEYLSYRLSIGEYAKPISRRLYSQYQTFSGCNPSFRNLIFSISLSRNDAINFQNVSVDKGKNIVYGNTIEFRVPNGTLNPVIWQNNVYFFLKLLKYAKSKDYNDDIINRRYQKNCHISMNLASYDNVYTEQALELADMLFDNNLDKLYFLRQYFKSMQIARDGNLKVKAKTFTKEGINKIY